MGLMSCGHYVTTYVSTPPNGHTIGLGSVCPDTLDTRRALETLLFWHSGRDRATGRPRRPGPLGVYQEHCVSLSPISSEA